MLEAGDVGRNPRLGEVDPIRGASETPGIHDLQPRAQPSQFEIQSRLLNCGVTRWKRISRYGAADDGARCVAPIWFSDGSQSRFAIDGRSPLAKGSAMKYRRFGRIAWSVSEIGYGMWGMGNWRGSDAELSLDALQRAVDLGCNFFDTALAYGEGRSEGLLGRVVRANPGKRIHVSTKVPPQNRQWPSRREFTLDDCYPPAHVEASVHQSLKNTGLQHLDLVLLHTWEDSWLDDDRWFRTLDHLRREGLIQAFGISVNRWEPWNGVRAVRSGLIDAVQVIYNIFDQNPEDELLPACVEGDVAVIARVPFDEGSLAGTLTLDSQWPEGDWRKGYFVPENLSSSVQHAEAVRPLVPIGVTMPEMALRFILSNPAVSTTIPGMRESRYVEANVAASDAGPLPRPLLERLRVHRWERHPTEWSQ
jgi:aryl-alcohol dehydrogenase-like predicted oxidoreductase